MNYYDIVALSMGALLIAGILASLFVGQIGIVAGSILSLPIMFHALFINPPTETYETAVPQEQTPQ